MRETMPGGVGRVRTGSTDFAGVNAITAALAGSMGESAWIGSRWTAPTLIVWQASLPSVELPPVMPAIVCAPAWCAPRKQSATQPTTGWAAKKATRVARAKPRERRVCIEGEGNRRMGGRTGDVVPTRIGVG